MNKKDRKILDIAILKSLPVIRSGRISHHKLAPIKPIKPINVGELESKLNYMNITGESYYILGVPKDVLGIK